LVGNKRAELEQLVASAKFKAGNSERMVELLLETQQQKERVAENSRKDKLTGKIETYRSILEDHLTQEELQTLLNKQTEPFQLKKHLESLQKNQEQITQIQQSYPPKQQTPSNFSFFSKTSRLLHFSECNWQTC
jgi:hypothetical protein